MRNKRTYVLAAVLLTFFTTGVFAAAREDCQASIRQQVRQKNPKVEKVVFHADTESKEERSQILTVLKGKGEFQRHTGNWEKIVWECNYNPEKGAVINAFYTVITSEHPEAGSPVAALKDLVGERAGQAEGEVKRRGYTNLKSTGGGYTYWREEKTGYCVSIRTDNGRYQSITYATAQDCK